MIPARYKKHFYWGAGIASVVLWLWIMSVLTAIFGKAGNIAVSPWYVFYIYKYYGHLPKTESLLFFSFLVSMIPMFGLARFFIGNKKIRPFGDAKWAGESEIKEAGLRANVGILLGQRNGVLCSGDDSHILVCAATRAGKGVGLVIPNLLNWDQSAIVHDIKGENYAKTAGFRAAHGHKVYFWNPADPQGRTHRINPFDFVRWQTISHIDDLQTIAGLLLPHQKEDDHWSQEARELFLGLSLYLKHTSEEPLTFGRLRFTLMGQGNFTAFVTEAIKTKGLSSQAYMSLNGYLNKVEKEQSGIVSTLSSALELWASPVIDAATSRSDFDLSQLRREKITVYVGVPPNKIDRLGRLLRIFYEMAATVLTETTPLEDEPYKVLFLMDEFASLGHMAQFEKGVAQLAGYQIRFMLVVQEYQQLEKYYGASGMHTFMGNCHLKVLFGINSLATAEHVSKSIGYFGVKTESNSKTKDHSVTGIRKSESQAETSRALIMPQEILQLPRKEMMILAGSTPPIKAEKILYFEDERFKTRVLPTPEIEPVEPIHCEIGKIFEPLKKSEVIIKTENVMENVRVQRSQDVDVPEEEITINQEEVLKASQYKKVDLENKMRAVPNSQ